MKPHFLYLFRLSLTLCFGLLAISSTAQQLIPNLQARGFENLQLEQRKDTLVLAFEDRLYRYELEGLAQVITQLPEGVPVILIAKYHNIPMVELHFPATSVEKWRSGELTSEALVREMGIKPGHHSALPESSISNATFWKVDLAAGPVISATQIGNYDDAIKTVIDLAPTVHMQLTNGLSITGQLLIPVFNNFTDDGVRAGLITLNQHMRLGKNWAGTLHAGLFQRRRAGVIGYLTRYFWQNRLGVFGEAGYHTYSTVSGSLMSEFFEKYNFGHARIGVIARHPVYDLTFKASYGTFMIQDRGWRVDIYRQFGQSIIGIFGVHTPDLPNAGFTLRLPLPIRKYPAFKRARIRTLPHLRYEYKFTGQTFRGLSIHTGTTIQEQIWNYHPDFIRNNLAPLLTSTRPEQ
ncbi:YjbH domain-containing protein [Marinoscillum furvescens]|uniref:Exopolysaccharide biosynthesis protein YbjH n=1 Tax=Marinoscillum furvescens DSM 4134 TaxID=1122208 RepID=A0A3D9L310_MARFU|nr:YjbH domain-containing protein [Marinoscillum furvescens]RED96162.1 exopolysaccharide biosynthesis protein YbjH [Marinoscillum furvescens DSM 4134]